MKAGWVFGLVSVCWSEVAVAQALDTRTDAEIAAAAPVATPEPEVGPLMTAEQLRHEAPDLELRTHDPLRLGLQLGPSLPFHLLALGGRLDSYIVPSFRLTLLAAVGIGQDYRRRVYGTFSGEVGIGVVVWRKLAHTAVTLPLRIDALGRQFEPRAILPLSHSLEVEAGLIAGYVKLYRCVVDCSGPLIERSLRDAGLGVWVPYAGLRYKYFRWARSLQAQFRSTQRFGVGLDLLIRTTSPETSGLQNNDGQNVASLPLGARLEVELPAFGCSAVGPCGSMDLGVGYFPFPAGLLLSAGVVWF